MFPDFCKNTLEVNMNYTETIVKKFDQSYHTKPCEKCGRTYGMKLQYIESLYVLYVTCRECEYTYRMEPKNP